MKRLACIVVVFAFCFMFCACSRVIVTSADELTTRNWQTETPSGVKGELTFQGDNAALKVTSSEDEISISGHLSVDADRFYITSSDFYRTYTFSYLVFHNRVEVTYEGNTLVFYPAESAENID